MSMNRKRLLMLNTASSLLKQLIGILCGFILPRYILGYYGSEVNGLISSITKFLGLIAIFDGGMSVVVQASLFSCIAEKDNDKQSAILVSCQKFYMKLVILLAVYVALLIALYPIFVSEQFDFVYIATLIIAVSISLFGNYCLGVSNSVLLEADQKGYIINFISCGATILNTGLSVALIIYGASIQTVKFVSSIVFVIRPFVLALYVKLNYDINWGMKYSIEPIKQKWNGFSQHIAFIILDRTDVVVITMFSTLSNVSIYSIYYMVIIAVSGIVESLTKGIRPLFGDMIARNEMKLLNSTYDRINWLFHNISAFVFSCTAVLLNSFVLTYTSGIIDADYNQPTLGLLLSMAYLFYSLRLINNQLVMASGEFKETQASAIIEAVINIVVSIALVCPYGLIGIAIGTVAAMFFRMIYLSIYTVVKSKVSSPIQQFKMYVMDATIFLLVYGICGSQQITEFTYTAWVVYALKVSLIGILSILLINFIAFKKYLYALLSRISKRLTEIIKFRT